MEWINKATVTGLRLCKKENHLFYEISPHAQHKFLTLDTEDTIKGVRLQLKEMTVLEIKRMFPELDTEIYKRLLYAWEKYTCERWERKELDKYARSEILKLREEIKTLRTI